MRYLITILVVMIMTSCIEEHVLPLEELDEKPSYFIECYLIPNDVYKLSATKLQAINEDYILDYSLEFDVEIDTISLVHGLYREENATYVYNYGHWYRFKPNQQKEVSLKVISPDGEVISGSTTIPSSLTISTASFNQRTVVMNFVLDEAPKHNYYIGHLKCYFNDSTHQRTKYFDLSHLPPNDYTSVSINTVKSNYDSISATLMRITEANYKYQLSLNNAISSNRDNLVQPTPLQGNLVNSSGIFTSYSSDIIKITY